MSAHSIKLLLHGAIDYAGLFPPAALDMVSATLNYSQYRQDPDAWALGRFIVPVARLREFEQEAERLVGEGIWKISALGGPHISLEQKIISEFNARHAGRCVIETLEIKAATVEEIHSAASLITAPLHVFIEIPISDDPLPLLRALRENKLRAKVRTGGITPEAFPRSDHLARFISSCSSVGVPFKATAGLHHPLRGSYRLTYAPASGRTTMFGFLNVLMAAALARQGAPIDTLIDVLEEDSLDAFRFEDTGAAWRSHRFNNDVIRDMRDEGMLSFGSCSFREPIDELREIKLI